MMRNRFDVAEGRRIRAVSLLATGHKVVETAQRLGVGPMAVYRLLRQPAFVERVALHRASHIRQVAGQLAYLCDGGAQDQRVENAREQLVNLTPHRGVRERVRALLADDLLQTNQVARQSTSDGAAPGGNDMAALSPSPPTAEEG
jgi:hypothetical protein